MSITLTVGGSDVEQLLLCVKTSIVLLLCFARVLYNALWRMIAIVFCNTFHYVFTIVLHSVCVIQILLHMYILMGSCSIVCDTTLNILCNPL